MQDNAHQVAHRVTVYRADGTADSYRITSHTHMGVARIIDALTESDGAAEIVDLWEEDGRVQVTRDGEAVRYAKRAPKGATGSRTDCRNGLLDRAMRMRAVLHPEAAAL